MVAESAIRAAEAGVASASNTTERRAARPERMEACSIRSPSAWGLRPDSRSGGAAPASDTASPLGRLSVNSV